MPVQAEKSRNPPFLNQSYPLRRLPAHLCNMHSHWIWYYLDPIATSPPGHNLNYWEWCRCLHLQATIAHSQVRTTILQTNWQHGSRPHVGETVQASLGAIHQSQMRSIAWYNKQICRTPCSAPCFRSGSCENSYWLQLLSHVSGTY